MADEDRKRYETEAHANVTIDPEPKKPCSPFTLFVGTFIKSIRETQQDLKCTEAMKLAATTWSTLSDEEKIPYT